jgi:hypothetical protein
MKETKTIKEMTERHEIIAVTCDFCKKSFKKDLGVFPGGSIVIEFGYGSKHDLRRFTGDICDDCLDKHFKGKLQEEEIVYL